MKRKSLVMAAVAAACMTSFAFATPQTQWEQGQWQIDLGAWNPKAEVDADNFYEPWDIQESSDSKWNFQGGLTYGLTNKWALQYQYYGLKTDANGDTATDGDAQEVNLVYSINKNLAAYAGWNRINNDLTDWSNTNNVAQIGLIARAPLAKNLDIYAKGALGTKNTAIWEAGLGYSVTPDLDISAGYRYVNTELADAGEGGLGLRDDANITYKGFIAGLSYRFGGGHEEEPIPEPVYEPAPEPVAEEPAPAPIVKQDYYLDSIHFGFDEDQPLPAEQAKLDRFVQTAKANPQDTFKLVGNTDGKGTNAYNDDLSKRRVDRVAAYAESQGVPASQMELDYKGKTNPVSTNETAQGRADNRRVDIWQNK